MALNTRIIKRVLCENAITYVAILALGIFARVLVPTLGDDSVGIRWKYEIAQFVYEISPFPILVACKVLAMYLLDLFCLCTTEKQILLCARSDEVHNIVSKSAFVVLWERDNIFLQTIIAYTHIIEPIWLDKRITNMHCQIAHTYQIKMLRFSHLVVAIEEISDEQALQQQLYYTQGLIEEQQEKIDSYQQEIHEQQRKYAIQHQKYIEEEDEQRKDVYFSMMHHIEKEIVCLTEEKLKQEKLLESYEYQKQKLEQKIRTEQVDSKRKERKE